METKDAVLSTQTEMKYLDLSTRKETNASTSASASSSSSSSKAPGSRTLPRCARCRNHGLQMLLKDHKRFCKYRKCTCVECKLTVVRQRVMAEQTMRRRAQAQDQHKLRAADEVDPPPLGIDNDRLSAVLQHARSVEGSYDSSSGDSPISNHDGNSLHTGNVLHTGLGGAITIPTSWKVASSHPHTGAPPSHLPQCQFSAEILLVYTMQLMEKFNCPLDILPYMYVIMKFVNGNIDEAVNGIYQGIYDIRAMSFWNEFRIHHQLSRSCYTGYTGPTEAPTYEGQVPYIGVTPPSSAIDLGHHPHTQNSHIPATTVPFIPENLPEHSASLVKPSCTL